MRYNPFQINIPIFLLSLCICTAAWYVITVNDRVDIIVDVRLDYQGLPEDLIILDGLATHMTVRIRGAKALIDGQVTTSNSHIVDLSSLTVGENIIPFAPHTESRFRAFEIIETIPEHLIIHADTMLERNVPLTPTITTNLSQGAFKVVDLTVTPNTALIHGPSSTVGNIESFALPISIDPSQGQGSYNINVPLYMEAEKTYILPKSVHVSYTVVSTRVNLDLQVPIVFEAQDVHAYSTASKYVTVTVEVPEALSNDLSYLEQLKVSLTPPILEVGQSSDVDLNIIVPDGMTVLAFPVERVTITRVN